MHDAHTADSFKLYNLAAMYYRKATETDSGNKIAWIKRGEYYMERQDLDSGTWCFSKAIAIDTLFAEAYYKRALSLKWNETDLPVNDLTKAIQLKPDYGEAYKERAWNLLERKKDSLALADYTKALEFIKDDGQIYLERGKIFHSFKENKKALSDLTEGLKVKSGFTRDLFLNRGVCEYDMGMYKEAITDFTKALDMYSEGWLYYNRALCKFRLGDLDGAIADKSAAYYVDGFGKDIKDSIPFSESGAP